MTAAPPKSGHAFSFLSTFFSKDSITLSIKSKLDATSSRLSLPPNISMDSRVNRRLTVLDNSMLEECVDRRQFEYDWKIYEGMGHMLEDKGTVKIVMKLCKRALLSRGGPGANLPESPNLSAKDIRFEDEILVHDQDDGDDF